MACKDGSYNIEVLNKCPVCGGVLYTSQIGEYTIDHQIGLSGRELKATKKKTDLGPVEGLQIYCEKGDFVTDFDLHIEKPENMARCNIYRGKQDVFYLEKEDE